MFDKKIMSNFKNFFTRTFTVKQILFLCREIEKSFDKNKLSNFSKSVDLPKLELVDLILNHFIEINKIDELISISINKKEYLGEVITPIGLDNLLKSFANAGYIYNFEKGRIEKKDKSKIDFGLLFSGKEYYLAFISADIAKSTELIKNYSEDLMSEVFQNFKEYTLKRLLKYDGRLLEWEGDGGQFAFYENITNSVFFGIELLMYLDIFNSKLKFMSNNVNIRIAGHTGWILYQEEYHKMPLNPKKHTERIQKYYTPENSFLITEEVHLHLNAKLRDNFVSMKKDGHIYYEFNKKKQTIY